MSSSWYSASQLRQRRDVAGIAGSFLADILPSPEARPGLAPCSDGVGCRGVTGPVPSASLDAERDGSRFRSRRYQTSLLAAPRALRLEVRPPAILMRVTTVHPARHLLRAKDLI